MVLAALALAASLALLVPPAPGRRPPPDPVDPAAAPRADLGRLRRHRLPVSALAGLGVAVVLGGPVGLVGAPLAAAVSWVVLTRSEPPGARLRAQRLRRDLPALVTLLGSALRAGLPPGEALGVVADALPGPGAATLDGTAARLRLGDDPAAAWRDLARDPDLGSLGRTLGRAHATGAPVVGALERLADDLARAARADTEDRARAVGVKAAVPLGLCLLPAFVLVGIVPLVAGLVGSLGW